MSKEWYEYVEMCYKVKFYDMPQKEFEKMIEDSNLKYYRSVVMNKNEIIILGRGYKIHTVCEYGRCSAVYLEKW